jgi:spore maturation protein CgeB
MQVAASGARKQPTLLSSPPSKGKYVSAGRRRPNFTFGEPLKITIFGLTLSSSWGNGHATPYRAILKALNQRGCRLVFYEKDAPYYARHRDIPACEYCDLQIYGDWNEIRGQALRDAADSDVVLTASYTPNGAVISDAVLDLPGPLHVFYDLDTPITLNRLHAGPLEYLRLDQIPEFDLYLSFTGGELLDRLEQFYGARMARPLYGCVDPAVYHHVPRENDLGCALSYLGTYAADRQTKLDTLFLEPARHAGELEFLLAGSLYPFDWQWPGNVRHIEHLAPDRHSAMYSSSRATLNATRQEMAASGYCPSGRFFEAAACGAPILTDYWNGLDHFFDISSELAVVATAEDVLSRLRCPGGELEEMAERARCRTLEQHTGDRRAVELLAYCEEARQPFHSKEEVLA